MAAPLMVGWLRLGDWVQDRWERSQPESGWSLRNELWWQTLNVVSATPVLTLMARRRCRRRTLFPLPAVASPKGRWL